MLENSVKRALRDGRVQLGCQFGQLRSPEVIRLLKAAGFTWSFVDLEHGAFDFETVQDLCRVAYLVDFCPVVRVADLRYDLVARVLDLGARGVLFPRVESPELLEQALSWTKYPPTGIRGYGLGGPQADYQAVSPEALMRHMDEQTLVVMQIETVRALEAREELLSVPGIDAVMIGPMDLSISLGVPGDFENPKLIAAMSAILETCLAHGIIPGTHTLGPPMARYWIERGMKLVGCGSELGMLWDGARAIATSVG